MPAPNKRNVVRVRQFSKNGVKYRIHFYRNQKRGRIAHVQNRRRQRGSQS